MTSIRTIMNGVLFANADAVVQLLNPAAEDLLGIPAFTAIGKSFPEMVGHPELVEPLQEDHAAAAAGTPVSRTLEVHHSEQDLLYIKADTTPVADHEGVFGGVMTVLEDVTDEYKSDQLKNQYLSIVAHELRTPLTCIKTFSTMMAKAALGDLNERQQQAMDAIREQSLQLEHQIDKLINLGYLESNDYGRDLGVFDADELVASAAATFARPASDRGINLEVRCESGAMVRADRVDVRRAVQALVENAVKFTPEGRDVLVSTELVDGEVLFSVRDSGIGIDPRYHRRIFEKFFQVEDPLTRHHGGAGLGLFGAQQVVDAHGSAVEVESSLGAGATFSFRLPTYEGAALPVGGADTRVHDATHGE